MRRVCGLRSAARATATASATGASPLLEKLVKKLDEQDVFSLQGPEYARPKGHADDSLNHWYNRRSFSISCERNYDALSYSRELLGAVKAGYEFLMPYYEYFDKSYRMAD